MYDLTCSLSEIRPGTELIFYLIAMTIILNEMVWVSIENDGTTAERALGASRQEE